MDHRPCGQHGVAEFILCRDIRLRRATEEIITKIKYMNRVAVTMRHGMLDSEGASQELELIQKQIEEIVKTLPFHAGIEETS